jgi:hypothetical protein
MTSELQICLLKHDVSGLSGFSQQGAIARGWLIACYSRDATYNALLRTIGQSVKAQMPSRQSRGCCRSGTYESPQWKCGTEDMPGDGCRGSAG